MSNTKKYLLDKVKFLALYNVVGVIIHFVFWQLFYLDIFDFFIGDGFMGGLLTIIIVFCLSSFLFNILLIFMIEKRNFFSNFLFLLISHFSLILFYTFYRLRNSIPLNSYIDYIIQFIFMLLIFITISLLSSIMLYLFKKSSNKKNV